MFTRSHTNALNIYVVATCDKPVALPEPDIAAPPKPGDLLPGCWIDNPPARALNISFDRFKALNSYKKCFEHCSSKVRSSGVNVGIFEYSNIGYQYSSNIRIFVTSDPSN